MTDTDTESHFRYHMMIRRVAHEAKRVAGLPYNDWLKAIVEATRRQRERNEEFCRAKPELNQ